jgi:hypothetical protein
LSVDWKNLARSLGYTVSQGDTITVQLDGGSSQTLFCEPRIDENVLRIWSVIARQRTVAEVAGDESPLRYAWERNRLSDLVGFTLDARGRLIGETWISYEGLTADELGFSLAELARVCDWHEFRLAGEDVY